MKIIFDIKKQAIKYNSYKPPEKTNLTPEDQKRILEAAQKISEQTGENVMEVYRRIHPSTKVEKKE